MKISHNLSKKLLFLFILFDWFTSASLKPYILYIGFLTDKIYFTGPFHKLSLSLRKKCNIYPLNEIFPKQTKERQPSRISLKKRKNTRVLFRKTGLVIRINRR